MKPVSIAVACDTAEGNVTVVVDTWGPLPDTGANDTELFRTCIVYSVSLRARVGLHADVRAPPATPSAADRALCRAGGMRRLFFRSATTSRPPGHRNRARRHE